MNILPNTSIKELLDLNLISVRAYNVCSSIDVSLHTAGDIKKFVDAGRNFLNLKNCGRKSATELLSVAESVASFEEVAVEEQVTNKTIENRFTLIDADLRQIFIDEYELLVNDPSKDNNIIDVFKALFPNPAYLFDIQNHTSLLENIKNVANLDPRKQYLLRKEIKFILNEIRGQINKKIGIDNTYGIDYIAFIDSQDEKLNPTYLDFYRFEYSDDIHNFLDAKLEELTSNSWGIVKNFQRSYIKSTLDLIPLLDYSIERFIRKFGKKQSCIKYYQQVLVPFREILQSLENPDENLSLRLLIQYKFPFLLNDATEFVFKHYTETQTYPLFYILLQYLRNSNIREYQIFNMRFGIQNSEIKTLDEIACEFKLSRERIRQILAKPFLKGIPFRKIDEWEQYSDKQILLFTPKSEYYKAIMESEQLHIPFEAFAQLYCSLFSFTYNDNFEYVVLSKYADVVKEACSILTAFQKNNFSEDTYIPYSAIFQKKKFQSCTATDLILNGVAKFLEIPTVNDTFFFEQNFIDVEKEVFDFLYDKGEPVHIDYIQKYLQEKYSGYHLALPTLKSKIRGSVKICPIGKTSMYKLSHWRNVYSGNIRDLIREIMKSRKLPIDIDELTDKVTDVFETTKKNIHSSISGCDDFIPFGNGLYGLRGKVYPPEYIEVDLSRLRAPFDVRFEQYKSFVEKYQHIPYASGEDEEDSLKRWQSNVYKKVLDVTDEQVELLKEFINANKHLPCNGAEYNFYRACRDYMDYVKTNFELPTRTNASTLYYWFAKQKTIANDYEDNRSHFFEELLSELRSYGFYI